MRESSFGLRWLGCPLLPGPAVPWLWSPVAVGDRELLAAPVTGPGKQRRAGGSAPAGTVCQPLDAAAQRDVLPSPGGQLPWLGSSTLDERPESRPHAALARL